MQILLVSATEMEIAPFLSLENQPDYLITGVGVPACLYHLTKKISGQKYDLIVQAGIAGSFSAIIKPGETVLVEKEVFADAGALEGKNLSSLFDLGLANKDEKPFSNGWLENSGEILRNYPLQKVKGITINTVSDDAFISQLYRDKYSPQVESMEGAAFHYVCLQENCAFIQMRAISNLVGERDKSKWKMKLAVDNLHIELSKLLAEYSDK